jgi:hypothetical protein
MTALLHLFLFSFSLPLPVPVLSVQHTSLTSSEITVTWLILPHQNFRWSKLEMCEHVLCGNYVWTNLLLLSLNATIYSLWDVSPGNPVSGSVVVVVVVVVVVDCLFSQFVAKSLLLTFCHGVHINILFKMYSIHTLIYIVPGHVSVLIHLIQVVRMILCPVGFFFFSPAMVLMCWCK